MRPVRNSLPTTFDPKEATPMPPIGSAYMYVYLSPFWALVCVKLWNYHMQTGCAKTLCL